MSSTELNSTLPHWWFVGRTHQRHLCHNGVIIKRVRWWWWKWKAGSGCNRALWWPLFFLICFMPTTCYTIIISARLCSIWKIKPNIKVFLFQIRELTNPNFVQVLFSSSKIETFCMWKKDHIYCFVDPDLISGLALRFFSTFMVQSSSICIILADLWQGKLSS